MTLEAVAATQDGTAETCDPTRAYEAFQSLVDEVEADADLDAVLAAVMRRGCRLLAMRRSTALMADEDTGLYRGRVLVDDGGRGQDVRELVAGIEADALTREIVATRQPVFVHDAMHDPRPVRSTMRRWNVHSVIGVPMVRRGEVLGVLFFDNEGRSRPLGDDTLTEIATFANLAGLLVGNVVTSTALRRSAAEATSRSETLRQAAAAQRRLADMVLSGATLDELAGTVARFAGKPCWLRAADGRILSAGAASEDRSHAQRFEAGAAGRPEIAQAFARLRPGVPTVVGPFPGAGVMCRLLVEAVRVDSHVRGHLVLKESGSRFRALDAHLLRAAAAIVAMEVSAGERVMAAQRQSRGAVVRDIVAGVGEEGELAARAAAVGLTLDAPHVLCLLRHPRGVHDQAPTVAGVLAASRMGDDAVVARVDDGVAMLVPCAARRGEAVAAALATLEEVATRSPDGGEWVMAASEPFAGVAGLARAYREAVYAARCLATFGRSGTHVAASQLGAARLFLASTTRPEAGAFVADTLGPLAAAESGSARDLLLTLAAFCETSYSVRETAAALAVHENTIRYRLARITEMTGLDVVANADHQVAVQIATLVLRLEGRLPLSDAWKAPAADG